MANTSSSCFIVQRLLGLHFSFRPAALSKQSDVLFRRPRRACRRKQMWTERTLTWQITSVMMWRRGYKVPNLWGAKMQQPVWQHAEAAWSSINEIWESLFWGALHAHPIPFGNHLEHYHKPCHESQIRLHLLSGRGFALKAFDRLFTSTCNMQ